MDYWEKMSKPSFWLEQDIVCVGSADCSSLDIVLVCGAQIHDAVAGCECFEQRSLHRLNCRIDILAETYFELPS